MNAAELRGRCDARADLDGLYRVDAHHRVREIGIEAIEHGLAEARRHTSRLDRNLGAERIAVAADLPHEVFEFLHPRRIRAEEGIVVGGLGAHRVDDERADLAQVTADGDAEPRAQIFASNRAGRHAHDGLARRRTSATAVVAKAVLLLVGVVRVTGTEAILDLLVVARARIGVLDEDADGRARGLALEHAREDAHFI